MKNLIILFIISCTLLVVPQKVAQGEELPLIGSGASFPYQIYSMWFILFNRDNKDTPVSYTPKGSGSGIRDFLGERVDFAASDAAMNEEEIAAAKRGVQLLPLTAGEVVVVYNLPGVKRLNLPREVYPGIFLGKIRNWNHPLIQRANPHITLPDLDITVVTRADSSGTTFVFTKHLSTISEEFRNGPGFGKKVDWPVKNLRKSHINAGVASTIKSCPGAIGYIDYGFAALTRLAMAHLENSEGNLIAPGLEGGQAALAGASLPDNLIAWIPDPQGPEAYPITTFTWLIFSKEYDNPEKTAALRKMVRFFLDEGQKLSLQYGYIPLPEEVAQRVRLAIDNIGGPRQRIE